MASKPAIRLQQGTVMRAKGGDHICAIYSTNAELARTAARFLAEGLRNRERSNTKKERIS
jgi:hypothetical protein